MKFRLRDLTFDLDTRQLLRGHEELHLSPKAFELLKVLVEARPRVLAKADLHERLWPATFVSETNLASLVAEIREVIGDSARHPQFIRTAHRFGYAFCGEATEQADRVPIEVSPFCWLLRNGRRFALHAGENILGRDPDDGVRFDSPTVSRRHARITVAVGGASLEDLGSKNGTLLRGGSVTGRTELADGDEIRIGAVVLRFRSTSGSSTATWTRPQNIRGNARRTRPAQ